MPQAHAPQPLWTIAAPVIGWLLLGGQAMGLGQSLGMIYQGLMIAGLLGGVLAAVHHAEVVAHRVGEPLGSLILAGAITAIEVALIVTLMLAGGESATTLARDTVFATVMIILNGIVGICLLVGGHRHLEQRFEIKGVNAALSTLAAIVVLTMVLPVFTSSVPGPVYSNSQLGFIAVVCLLLYAAFLFIQTIRHRDYFLPSPEDAAVAGDDAHVAPPSTRAAWISAGLLVLGLAAVVLLAKSISPLIEAGVAAIGAPATLVGVIIAAIVLLPEGLAALGAAKANLLQTSLNLALGSALASIGLTIPVVALVAIANGWQLTLGLDPASIVLVMLSLLVATLSLGTGRTTVLQGVVHLAIFATYLFMTVFP
ncbi:MAG: ionic transporter y4hA [Burkholderiaceae bacterium]|nr:ionic transporter y4hA [Burkholderiaceae bacterium]